MAVQYINAQENIMFNFVDCAKNFPVSGSFKKVVWRKNVVEELTELANLYYKQMI